MDYFEKKLAEIKRESLENRIIELTDRVLELNERLRIVEKLLDRHIKNVENY